MTEGTRRLASGDDSHRKEGAIMNFSFTKVAFMGVLSVLLMGAPGFAQTSVGPDAEQETILASNEARHTTYVVAAARNECGVEPTRRALNPLLVECHAQFFPIPPPTAEGAEELVTLLRAVSEVDVSFSEPIGMILLTLDPEWRHLSIPQTRMIPIWRVKGSGGTSTTVVGVAYHDGYTEAYTGPKIRELLLPRVVLQACDVVKKSGFTMTVKNPCVDLPPGVKYRPKAFLAKKDATALFTPEAIDYHFRLETYVVHDVQALAEEVARIIANS